MKRGSSNSEWDLSNGRGEGVGCPIKAKIRARNFLRSLCVSSSIGAKLYTFELKGLKHEY